jgi:hypothetical protein
LQNPSRTFVRFRESGVYNHPLPARTYMKRGQFLAFSPFFHFAGSAFS